MTDLHQSIAVQQPTPGKVLPRMTGFQRFVTWLSALFLDHAFFRFWFNTRSRVADGFFRSSHPMPYQLRAAARQGIRTVVNLRGNDDTLASNRLEWEACRDIGIDILHFPLSSRDAPEVEEILGLAQFFDTVQGPVWVHCKSGADRAGIVSALYLLLCKGASYAEASRQLSFWRFGHVSIAKTGILDHFLATFAAANAASGIGFLDWARTQYDREAVRRSFRGVSPLGRIIEAVLRRE